MGKAPRRRLTRGPGSLLRRAPLPALVLGSVLLLALPGPLRGQGAAGGPAAGAVPWERPPETSTPNDPAEGTPAGALPAESEEAAAQKETPPAAAESAGAAGAAVPGEPAGAEAATAQGAAETEGPGVGAAAAVAPEGQPTTAAAPRSVDDLYRLGRQAQGRGARREAERHYRAVLERAPYHFGAHVALARLKLERDPAGAHDHLRTALRVHPSSDAAHFLRGQALEALGRDVDAAEAYRRAIHLNPRHYAANERLRGILRRLRAGRSVVERAAESFYANPNLATLTLFGRLVMEHAEPREAVLEFEQVRRRAPGLAEAELWLARAHHAAGDAEAELAAYRRYLEANPGATGVRLLVVERLAARGWYRNAVALLEPVANSDGELPPETRARVMFLRSRLLSARQQPGRAGELLLRAFREGYARTAIAQAFGEDLDLFPEAPALWFAYGNWLRETGRPGEAADALRRAGVLDPGHRRKAARLLRHMRRNASAPEAAALALAELALADGRAEDALARLETIPPGHPRDVRASLLRGRVYHRRGEADAALAAFIRYVFAHGDARDAHYARGNVLWTLGQREAAIAVWNERPGVLDRHPRVLLKVAGHFRAAGEAAREIATRERLTRLLPAHHANRVRLGALYAAQGRRLDAVLLWEQVLRARPRDPELLLRVGQAWLALRERERALPLLRRAAQLTTLPPDSAEVLARALYDDKQYEEALSVYWDLYRTRPGHPDLPRVLPTLALNLPADPEIRQAAAKLALEAGRLGDAGELLEAQLNERPGDVETRRALAQIYVRQDKPEAAEAVLLDEHGGSGEEGLRLLAEVQAQLGRRDALAETLARLQRRRPGDLALMRRRALLLHDLRRHEAARGLLERVAAERPGDVEVALALGDTARAQDDLDTAEAQYTAILARMPEHAMAQGRLIDLLLKRGRVEEAIPRLETWVAQHPRDAEARYNLVAAYMKRYRREEARPHYEALRELSPRKARPLARYFR